MSLKRPLLTELRAKFDDIYDSRIVGGGFFETEEYYRLEKERYWRSMKFLFQLNVPYPARILEIGGGQIALLSKMLFNDNCIVADVSDSYAEPIRQADIQFFKYNLLEDISTIPNETFDIVILLEVIEHIPIPGYIVFRRIARFLTPGGILFVTTPNLFRVRNLVRMFLGHEFLSHFKLPLPEEALGHQLEYSSEHLRWQLEQAGLRVIFLEHDELGHIGHSPKARLARSILSPLRIRRIWRDELVAAGQKS